MAKKIVNWRHIFKFSVMLGVVSGMLAGCATTSSPKPEPYPPLLLGLSEVIGLSPVGAIEQSNAIPERFVYNNQTSCYKVRHTDESGSMTDNKAQIFKFYKRIANYTDEYYSEDRNTGKLSTDNINSSFVSSVVNESDVKNITVNQLLFEFDNREAGVMPDIRYYTFNKTNDGVTRLIKISPDVIFAGFSVKQFGKNLSSENSVKYDVKFDCDLGNLMFTIIPGGYFDYKNVEYSSIIYRLNRSTMKFYVYRKVGVAGDKKSLLVPNSRM